MMWVYPDFRKPLDTFMSRHFWVLGIPPLLHAWNLPQRKFCGCATILSGKAAAYCLEDWLIIQLQSQKVGLMNISWIVSLEKDRDIDRINAVNYYVAIIFARWW